MTTAPVIISLVLASIALIIAITAIVISFTTGGDQGPKGDTGPQGPVGPTGPAGPSCSSPIQDIVSQVISSNSDTVNFSNSNLLILTKAMYGSPPSNLVVARPPISQNSHMLIKNSLGQIVTLKASNLLGAPEVTLNDGESTWIFHNDNNTVFA